MAVCGGDVERDRWMGVHCAAGAVIAVGRETTNAGVLFSNANYSGDDTVASKQPSERSNEHGAEK